LKKSGIKDIVLLIGWQSGRISDYFGTGDRLGVDIKYVQQTERFGTAHAIGTARKYLDETFLCLNGDILITEDLVSGVLKYYKNHKSSIMGLARVEDPSGLGVVKTENQMVNRIIEKPKTNIGNLINAGIYIFETEVFDAIDKTKLSVRGEYEITDTIEILIHKMSHPVFAYELESEWLDISMPWHLLNANELLMEPLKSKNLGTIEKFATIEGPVQIGKGTIVRNGSYIIGPVIIGDDCDIGPNCYLRPKTTIGNNCKIGNAVEVKNSIIMNNTQVPHHIYIGDSVIGENCNFGSGTKVANLRLDNKNVHTFVRGTKIETNRRKLGVIMGDNVKTGINSTINIGTVIGENSSIGPGAIASGAIAPNSKIY